jgi:AmmeMemoRadiSam system protein B
VLVDDELIAADHAVTNQLPMIREYLPEAEVAAVLISSHIGREQLAKLVAQMHEFYVAKDTLVVGSIDFSHYLTLTEMEKRDQQMRQWLASEQPVMAIAGVGDEYTDSWAGLVLMLELMAARGARLEIADYSNSALETNDLDVETATSYFYLRWWEE